MENLLAIPKEVTNEELGHMLRGCYASLPSTHQAMLRKLLKEGARRWENKSRVIHISQRVGGAQ